MKDIWVREFLDYKDGKLYWIKCLADWVVVGSEAGSLINTGYREIGLRGGRYLYHHVVWFWHYGYWPDLLDHIDRDINNNRIENLRETSKRMNSLNRDAPKNSKSGKAGVSWDSQQQKWTVRWKEESGKYSFLGYFENLERAIEVRIAKEKEASVYG